MTKKHSILSVLAIMCIATMSASSFEQRRDYLLDHYSTSRPLASYDDWGDDDIKTAMGFVLARLETGTDTAYALDMLERMQEGGFDMFDCHQNIDAYLRFSAKYPQRLKQKVRERMTAEDYFGNGSTENHKLMFKTAGYLTALAFPDWEKSTAVMEHCREELVKMMENTVRWGIKEFDSPTYGTFYITCLLSLYDFCKDDEFRNMVRMTLEWHLLNFAPEWMNGYFVSSSLREYYFACSPHMMSPYPLVGWLFFGGGPFPELEQKYAADGELVVNNEGFFSILAAVTSYRLPAIIGDIASRRSEAYVHRESHDMNPSSQLNYPYGFKKYTYINKTYGLASQWDGTGGLGWSEQMRRWKLVWESDAPASTFFLTHPCYYSRAAANMFGATPREQVLQHEGTLLAMYKIESGEPYPFVEGVVPVDAIKEMKEDPSGWIFFDGGSVLFAVRFAHPYSWDGEKAVRGVRHRILRCDERSTAAVVETVLPEAYPSKNGKTSLELFAQDVLAKTALQYVTTDVEYRQAIYRSLDGDELRLVFNRGRYVNGVEVDYAAWPLYSNPWMDQSVNGRLLNVRCGERSRVYDFENWTISEDKTDRRDEWMRKAEQYKPDLIVTERTPTGTVCVVEDPGAFQGWAARPSGSVEELYNTPFRQQKTAVVDFGEHLTGYVTFSVRSTGLAADGPMRLRLTFGEVPSEVAVPFDDYEEGLSRAWLQDEVVTVMSLPHTVTIPRRVAFRYVKIELLASSPYYDFNIHEIKCSAQTSVAVVPEPLPAGVDPMIREIDRVALNTLKECMQTVYEDGPKRDQRLWIGDLYLEALGNNYSFRLHDLTKRCLYLPAALHDDNGFLLATVIENPTPRAQDKQFLYEYALLYNVALKDYLEATGDRETAEDLWPVAKRQLDIVRTNVKADGLMDFDKVNREWWVFFDWKEGLHKEVALQGVSIFALRETYELAVLLGREKEVADLPALADKMTRAAHKTFYDKKSGLFAGTIDKQISYASQIWMILSGVATKAEGRKALASLATAPDVCYPGTPYMYHYYIQSLVDCGMHAEAKKALVDYWGGMIERGADTFWEAYDPGNDFISPYGFYPINSYCHAWSCTPVYFIRKYPGIFQN